MNSWIKKSFYNYGTIGLIFIVGSLFRYMSVNQTPYANGWDGYYYVMQMHSWLSYGHLQSVDSSLIYPYFICINYLLGDHVLAYKVGSSILGGLLVITSFLLVRDTNIKRSNTLLLAAYLIFSPTMAYWISQFPKNVLGVIFLLLFIKLLSNRKYVISALFALLSLLSHRMTGGICLVIISTYMISQLHWKWILAGFIVVISVSLLPGILHVSDLARFDGQLSSSVQFAPYAMYKLFRHSMNLWWSLELLLLSIVLVFLMISYVTNKDYHASNWMHSWGWPVLILISLFPFFTVAFGSMGYRFFMISPIVIICYLVGKLKLTNLSAYMIASILLFCSIFSYTSYNPKLHDPPNQQYELITDRLNTNFSTDKFPLVIVHKSLAEMIIYKTDFDALNWSPPPTAKPEQVLRIVSNLEYIHFSRYLNKNELKSIQKLTLHYFAMPEEVWSLFYNKVKMEKDEVVLDLLKKGGNPLEQRPYYLLKGKQNS